MTMAAAASAEIPAGWTVTGSAPQDYEFSRDLSSSPDSVSALIAAKPDIKPRGFGALMQIISAENYRGGRWRLSGYLKTSNATRAQMWMRVDGPDRKVIAFDNMESRPVTGTTPWKRYDIVLDVPQDSVDIVFGFLLVNEGEVWAEKLSLARVDAAIPVTSAPQAPTALPKEPVNMDFQRGAESNSGTEKDFETRNVIVHDVYRFDDDHRVRLTTVDQAEGQVPVEDDHKYNVCGMRVIAEAQQPSHESLKWDLILSVTLENGKRVGHVAAGSFIQPPSPSSRIPREPISALLLRVDDDAEPVTAELYGAPNADGGVNGAFPEPYAQRLFNAFDAGTPFALELTYGSGARERVQIQTRPGVHTANFFYHGSDAPVRRCLQELVPASRTGIKNSIIELHHPL